jgi:hypothetical protein
MQESIAYYDKELKSKVFLNLKQNDCVNYPDFRALHKRIRDESLQAFREKAVG